MARRVHRRFLSFDLAEGWQAPFRLGLRTDAGSWKFVSPRGPDELTITLVPMPDDFGVIDVVRLERLSTREPRWYFVERRRVEKTWSTDTLCCVEFSSQFGWGAASYRTWEVSDGARIARFAYQWRDRASHVHDLCDCGTMVRSVRFDGPLQS